MTELPQLRAALSDAAERWYGDHRRHRVRWAPVLRASMAFGAVAASIAAVAMLASAPPDVERPSSAGAPVAPAAPVVGCDRGGSGTFPEAARANGITAGPLLFAYAKELAQHPEIVRPDAEELRELSTNPDATAGERARARETFEHIAEDGYGLAGVMIVLEPGATATVALPAEEQDQAALIYTPGAIDAERAGAAGVYRLEDGDPAVTFHACKDGPTHWNGGFVVAGSPRCLPLLVWTSAGAEPLLRYLPIATGKRECPAGAE